MSSPTAGPERPLILCVDDDDFALRVRKLLLGSTGYDVLTASSGQAGIEMLQRNPVKLVIADHFLSDKNGTEIAWEMKALKPDVPILIVSGSVEELGEQQSADGFLSKGEAPEVLLDTVARLLRR